MQIVSKEESVCMKCQMLSPWEKKKKSKYGVMKLLHKALDHLFDMCKKFNTVGLKGHGFSQTLQDVFLAVVDLLNIKLF